MNDYFYMIDWTLLESISDKALFGVSLMILISSLILTIKTGFVQFRIVPLLIEIMKGKKEESQEGEFKVSPVKALFTAMSTTLGIGTIVAPIIAIRWGGPGALLGFLLTSFLGAAATYLEVTLCISYRKQLSNGEIAGGPMPYLKEIFSSKVAVWYAFFGSLLMAAWSAAQANQLAAILDSPLLGVYRIPPVISGIFLSLTVFLILIGGIKRISSFSAKLVPLMFTLYLGSIGWILISNLSQIPTVFNLILQSALTPYSLATGSLVGGIVSAMRWGFFKGMQVTEAGVGTQTIPHSMAETNDPHAQGVLAMLSTVSAGLIAFLSGLVALITKTWESDQLPLGISMVAASFYEYFSYFGIAIVAVSALLFAFGTILGNSYNGSQCYSFLTERKKLSVYYGITVVVIFLGTISHVKLVWSIIDLGLVCLVLPHVSALLVYVFRREKFAPSMNIDKLSA
jgi:AGCS family alanine or glycine:cation symporter